VSPIPAGQFTDTDGEVVAGAPAPLQCPFCAGGAEQLVVERWSEEDDPDAAYHVNCLKCDCYGPEAETALAAAQEWNRRRSAG
jgi:restriction alleviation protein Lar